MPTSADAHAAVLDFYRGATGPGFGSVSDAGDLAAAPCGSLIAFRGTERRDLTAPAIGRVCLFEPDGGTCVVVSEHAADAFGARWSSDGRFLAYLQRAGPGEPADVRFHVVDGSVADETVVTSADVQGDIQSVSWSADGVSLLLIVAPYGADIPGAAGSGRGGVPRAMRWQPAPEPSGAHRRLVLVDLADRTCQSVETAGLSVWEAAFGEAGTVHAIVSEGAGESAWYDAYLVVIDLAAGTISSLYAPPAYRGIPRQLGLALSGSSPLAVAVLLAICSDRGAVAGELVLVDRRSANARVVDTDFDVSHAVWTAPDHLVVAGIRGRDTVVADVYAETGDVREIWRGTDVLVGGDGGYPAVTVDGEGRIYGVRECHAHAPAIARLEPTGFVDQLSFHDSGSTFAASRAGRLEWFRWAAKDKSFLEGTLLLPLRPGPYPTIVWLHGGPVWTTTNTWVLRTPETAVLLDHGFAIFCPNPRGGSGHGVGFVADLVGDVGGVDTDDVLSGLDALVAAGVVDGERIGLTGGSYGGFLAAWLIGRTSRFAAAVVVSPITDWASFRLTSNIDRFAEIYVGMGESDAQRSPLRYAETVSTPTLVVVGERDLCTPPEQGVKYLRAIRGHGQAPCGLVVYPDVGHVPRDFPELGDYLARMVEWFERHLR